MIVQSPANSPCAPLCGAMCGVVCGVVYGAVCEGIGDGVSQCAMDTYVRGCGCVSKCGHGYGCGTFTGMLTNLD